MPKKYRRYQSGGPPSKKKRVGRGRKAQDFLSSPMKMEYLMREYPSGSYSNAQSYPIDKPLGGIMGLADRVKKMVGRDVRRGSGTEDTTRALMKFAERGGLSEEEKNRLFLSEGYEAPPEEHERFLRSIGAPERSIPTILGMEEWEERKHRRASGGIIGYRHGGPHSSMSRFPTILAEAEQKRRTDHRSDLERVRDRMKAKVQRESPGAFPELMHDKMQRGRSPSLKEMQTQWRDLERKPKRDIMRELIEEESGQGITSLMPPPPPQQPQRPPPPTGGMMASGGLIGFQGGGAPVYASPQAYSGYGMPREFGQRQEHLSPEVAQQYAALTQGIMDAGTRRYDDIRYKGPQLAGFTDMEAAAMRGAGIYGTGAGPMGTRQGMGTLSEAARGLGSMVPGQQALADQYKTLARDAKTVGTDAATEQERIAGLMETMGTQAKTAGTTAETAFKGLGTGMQSLADTSATAQRVYGTDADTLADTTATAQRAYGTDVDTLADATATAQRLYGTGADTRAGTFATAQKQFGTDADTLTDTSAKLQREAGKGVETATTAAEKAIRQYGTDVGTATTESVKKQRDQAQKDFATASAKKQRDAGVTGTELSTTSAAAQRALGTKLGSPTQLKTADLSPYMSQYTQGVTDPQLRQLMEFQQAQQQELGSQAAGAGAFGGSRADVEARKLREQTAQQASDVIGQNQQQAFEAARAAQIQDIASARAGQQAELSAEQSALAAQRAGGLDAQAAEQAALAAETGAQTRSLTAEQAALQQQMEAQRFGTAQEQAAHQARMQSEQFGLGAEQASLQAEMDAQRFGAGQGQVALQAQMDADRFGAGQEQAAHQAQLEAHRFGAGQEQTAHQAQMDAQRFGLSVEQGAHQAAMGGRQANLAAQQEALRAAQEGRAQYGQALTGAAGLSDAGAALEFQGYSTAANLMGGQQGAMGAQAGLYGRLAGIGGQQLGGGAQQQREQIERFDLMNRYGGQQRKLQQAAYDIAKGEHEKSVQYPERQIGWMNQQLGALPYRNIVSQSTYAPQAGPATTMMAAGIAGAGAAADWRGNQPNQYQPPNQGYDYQGTQPTGFTPPTFDTNINQPGQMGTFGQFGSQGGQSNTGGGLPAGGAFTPAGGTPAWMQGGANVTQGTGQGLLGGQASKGYWG